MLSLRAVTTPPKYKPRVPSVRMISFVIPQLDAAAVEEDIWARHLMSSVGVLTTHVASPPIAPATQVVHRFGATPVGFVFKRFDVRL